MNLKNKQQQFNFAQGILQEAVRRNISDETVKGAINLLHKELCTGSNIEEKATAATAADNQNIKSVVREVINEHYEKLNSISLTRE